MKRVKQEEELESSRMFEEEAQNVQAFPGGSLSSSSSLVAVGKVEKKEGDDGQGFLEVVTPLFPVDKLLEEIGLKIFGLLSDEDVANCFRVYPKWQQWLLHQRTRFLFPEVVPFLLKYLPKTSLLECRKVSRSWKNGLDNAYQAHPQHLQEGSFNFNVKMSRLTNRFESSNQITSFLQDMEYHPGNPFPGRILSLEWKFPQGLNAEENLEHLSSLFEDFWKISVIQLLHVFGHQVHFVCMEFAILNQLEGLGLEINNLNFNGAQILTRCLEKMPNLKNLDIYGERYDVWDGIEWGEEMRRMRIPLLENLETVSIILPPAPVDLIDSVLESCCNPNKIKRIAIRSMGDGFSNPVYEFQKLEVLDVEISLENLNRFLTLERRPPFRKLVLHFSEIVDWHQFIAFQQLFTVLEVFADTLKDLEMVMVGKDMDAEERLTMENERKGFRINLPKLERLSLKFYVGPLDPFTIQLPSLRNLELLFQKMQNYKGSAVQLHGFEERMESSNIWSLIPSLMTLNIAGTNDSGALINKKYNRRLFQICENGEEEETSQCESSSDSDMDFP